MKIQTKFILGVLFISLFQLGCRKDLLNVKNENSYTDDTYYQERDQFDQAVIGTYAVFNHGGLMSRNWYFIFDLLGNDAERAIPLIGTELELATYTHSGSNGDLQELWASLYRMVFRANLALKVLNDWEPASSEDQGFKAQYTAEARWMRGFAYFYLVTNWGRVPLKLTNDDANTVSTPRASVEDVWKVVEDDFKAAIPDLPVTYPDDQRGRATKGAAVGFLGKAYLYQGKIDDAITELSKLTQSPYSYILDPSYDHLFSEDNINSPEIIFAVNHIYTTPNTQYYMFGGAEGPDGKTGHTGRAQEYGFDDWSNVIVSDAVVSTFKYPNPTNQASVYTDPRAKLTFYGNSSNGGDVDYCDFCSDVIPYSYDVFGNRWRKYEPYEFQKNTEAPMSGINTIVMRYADVLLMLAECNIEKGGGDVVTGINYINEVRNRSGVSAVNYPVTLPQEEARVALRRERTLELAGEQYRWFDLRRWGVAVQTLNAEKPASGGQHAFQDKMLLMPVPINEINANPAVASDISGDWN